MFAQALLSFWPEDISEKVATETPKRRASPVFIYDAVQPWAGETLLLALLRDAAVRDLKDPD